MSAQGCTADVQLWARSTGWTHEPCYGEIVGADRNGSPSCAHHLEIDKNRQARSLRPQSKRRVIE
jgi:hypothetical protein